MKLKHRLALGNNFPRFKYCDASLTTDGSRSLPVHRAILASVSPKLEALFDSDDSNKTLLVVENVGFDSLERIIESIYSGEITLGDDKKDDLVIEAMEKLQISLINAPERSVGLWDSVKTDIKKIMDAIDNNQGTTGVVVELETKKNKDANDVNKRSDEDVIESVNRELEKDINSSGGDAIESVTRVEEETNNSNDKISGGDATESDVREVEEVIDKANDNIERSDDNDIESESRESEEDIDNANDNNSSGGDAIESETRVEEDTNNSNDNKRSGGDAMESDTRQLEEDIDNANDSNKRSGENYIESEFRELVEDIDNANDNNSSGGGAIESETRVEEETNNSNDNKRSGGDATESDIRELEEDIDNANDNKIYGENDIESETRESEDIDNTNGIKRSGRDATEPETRELQDNIDNANDDNKGSDGDAIESKTRELDGIDNANANNKRSGGDDIESETRELEEDIDNANSNKRSGRDAIESETRELEDDIDNANDNKKRSDGDAIDSETRELDGIDNANDNKRHGGDDIESITRELAENTDNNNIVVVDGKVCPHSKDACNPLPKTPDSFMDHSRSSNDEASSCLDLDLIVSPSKQDPVSKTVYLKVRKDIFKVLPSNLQMASDPLSNPLNSKVESTSSSKLSLDKTKKINQMSVADLRRKDVFILSPSNLQMAPDPLSNHLNTKVESVPSSKLSLDKTKKINQRSIEDLRLNLQNSEKGVRGSEKEESCSIICSGPTNHSLGGGRGGTNALHQEGSGEEEGDNENTSENKSSPGPLEKEVSQQKRIAEEILITTRVKKRKHDYSDENKPVSQSVLGKEESQGQHLEVNHQIIPLGRQITNNQLHDQHGRLDSGPEAFPRQTGNEKKIQINLYKNVILKEVQREMTRLKKMKVLNMSGKGKQQRMNFAQTQGAIKNLFNFKNYCRERNKVLYEETQLTTMIREPLSLSASSGPPQARLASTFGGTGIEPGKFRGPRAVAVDEDQLVYVVDSGNKRIQVFNQDYSLLFLFGTEQLTVPNDLAITRSSKGTDIVLVSDEGDKSIKLFTCLSGHFIRKLGLCLTGSPAAVSANSHGTVVVAEVREERRDILVCDLFGNVSSTFRTSVVPCSLYSSLVVTSNRKIVIPNLFAATDTNREEFLVYNYYQRMWVRKECLGFQLGGQVVGIAEVGEELLVASWKDDRLRLALHVFDAKTRNWTTLFMLDSDQKLPFIPCSFALLSFSPLLRVVVGDMQDNLHIFAVRNS